MSKLLSLTDLQRAAKRPVVEKEIKSLNGSVLVRHLTAAERDGHEQSVLNPKGEVDMSKIRGVRQRLVSLGLSDEEGNRLTSSTAELDKFPAEVIDELAEVVAQVNGMRQQDKEEAGNA